MKFKFIALPLVLTIFANVFFITTSHADNLTGAGSSFATNFIDRCRIEFVKTGSDSVSYNPIGSGAGKNMFTNNLVDFATDKDNI